MNKYHFLVEPEQNNDPYTKLGYTTLFIVIFLFNLLFFNIYYIMNKDEITNKDSALSSLAGSILILIFGIHIDLVSIFYIKKKDMYAKLPNGIKNILHLSTLLIKATTIGTFIILYVQYYNLDYNIIIKIIYYIFMISYPIISLIILVYLKTREPCIIEL